MLRQHHLLVFDGSLFGRLGCFGGRARPLVVRTDGFELDDGLATRMSFYAPYETDPAVWPELLAAIRR